MIMRGASSLLVLATLVKEASAACSVDTHHPENGGYYVAGINGLDNSAERSANGMRAADNTWAKGMDYHHGQLAACEGIFCPTPNPPVPQYIFAHTCAHIRFEYAADSSVWELPDQAALDACDFTNAELKGGLLAGMPYYEYKIEHDHEIGDVLYFASKEGCTEGQKAAVQIGEDYTATYGQCYDMGSSLSMGASRIKNCDCDFHLRPSTNTNPCHQGFHDGCMADMPDDDVVLPGRRRRVRLGDPLVHQRRHLPRQGDEGQARGERREAEAHAHLRAHRHRQARRHRVVPIEVLDVVRRRPLCDAQVGPRVRGGVAPRVVRHRPRVAHLPGDDDAGVHVPRRHAPPGEWWLLCRGHQRPRQLRRAQRERNARRRHDVGEGHGLPPRAAGGVRGHLLPDTEPAGAAVHLRPHLRAHPLRVRRRLRLDGRSCPTRPRSTRATSRTPSSRAPPTPGRRTTSTRSRATT